MSSQQNFDLILTMEGNKIYMETSNNFKMTSIKLKFKHPLIYKQSLQFGKTLISNMDNIWPSVENNLENSIFFYTTIDKCISSENNKSILLILEENNELVNISDISDEKPKNINLNKVKFINIISNKNENLEKE